MIQCCGQVIWVPVHLVLIEPGLKLVLRLESLVTTFQDCTYIRCQHVVLVIWTDALSHQVLRVHRVWLPLCRVRCPLSSSLLRASARSSAVGGTPLSVRRSDSSSTVQRLPEREWPTSITRRTAFASACLCCSQRPAQPPPAPSQTRFQHLWPANRDVMR